MPAKIIAAVNPKSGSGKTTLSMQLAGAVRLERASQVYRKLAAKYHPDHNPATAEIMKDLNELWQALKGT